MKKNTLTFFLLFCVHVLFAQSNDRPFDFPTKPNSAKWKAFTSVNEMYEACQIPNKVLSDLTTHALIQTCLEYPASTVLLIHNTPQLGFDDWKTHFNGLQALLNRNDLNEELIKFYGAYDTKGHGLLTTDIEKGRYTFKLLMLEAIIVQDEVTSRLTIPQKKALLKICLDKYEHLKTDATYGFSNITSTGRIIAKLLLGLGKLNPKTETQDLKEFISTGLLKDRQMLLAIIAETQNIDLTE